jgi:PAS domain S-box-containing protein/diguanylate cyclase (GGDEF)-like protein
MVDADGIIRLFNPACERAMGWPAHDAIGLPCWEVFVKASGSEGLRQFFEQLPENKGPAQVTGEWRARDGSVREIIWSTTWLRKADGGIEYFLGTGVDVTALRGAEEQVRYLSSFDTLTGLPNRILMRDRVRQMQEKANGGHELLGYLMLKPERLRAIGENLGIEAEEAMLRQLARRLARWEHGAASVARIGERTFAIAALRKSPEELAALARELLAELSLPFLHEGQEVHLDPAIGIAVYPNDGEDYDSLVQGSHAAVRRAMSGTDERCEFYRPELNQGANERFRIESALRRAIERGNSCCTTSRRSSLASGKHHRRRGAGALAASGAGPDMRRDASSAWPRRPA